MLLKILLYISIFSTSSLIIGQSYNISQIIETNLFELDNGQKVKLYGLYIPEREDTNATMSKLAEEIFQWENNNLLVGNISVEILGRSEDGIDLVAIYKHYPLFVKRNLAIDFLSNGYAALIQDMNKNYQNGLSKYQEEAQKSKLGIWKESLAIQGKNELTIFNSENQITVFKSNPYIPLLGLSIASFALSWDFFSTASDFQNKIDNLNNELKELPNNPIYRNYPDLRKKEEAIIKNQIDDYKSIKTRKTIVAVTCLVAGIVTTLYSFKTVEIKTNLQTISLNYRF